jgi:hypothetical protein
VPGPRDNLSNAELQADLRELTPGQRVAQASSLRRTLNGIARRG